MQRLNKSTFKVSRQTSAFIEGMAHCVVGLSDYGCDTVVCEAADLLHAAHLMHGGTHAPLHSTQSLSALLTQTAATAPPLLNHPRSRDKSSLCRLV